MKTKVNTPTAKAAIDTMVKLFEKGTDIPKAIAYIAFPQSDIPFNTWSLLNRMTAYAAIVFGKKITEEYPRIDARNYNAWKRIGRKVKTGAKAIYILQPKFLKFPIKDKNGNTIPIKDKDGKPIIGKDGKLEVQMMKILEGFQAITEFAASDTEGEPIKYNELPTPDFPLLDRAKEWGINVDFQENLGNAWGKFRIHSEEIVLATPCEEVFFHELAHAAHKKVIESRGGKMQGGQDARQEIVAEFSSQVLSYLVGKEPSKRIGNAYEYIKGYAESEKLTVGDAICSLIPEIEKVIFLILGIEKKPFEQKE